jgi:prepilin-type N-terminal cleavage/methylation domain-containing protein
VKRRRAGARAGLTLLELLVALLLTAVAVSLGYAAFAATADAHARATRDVDPVAAVAARREWLRGIIASARIGAPGDGAAFEGTDAARRGPGAGVAADDALVLVGRDDTGDDAWVRLHVERDPSAGSSGLVADVAPFPRRPGDRVRRLLLDPEVTAFDVSYLSPVPPRRWLPAWDAQGILPAAVRLRLDGERVHPLLRVPLTVPVGGGR